MCVFSDLDCGSDAKRCVGALGKEKDRTHCMLDDNLFLERNKVNTYSRVDPMLDEASLCLQVDHDIKGYV